MQKVYVFKYSSSANLFNGHLAVNAETLTEAQDKFFCWLREQNVYSHLWKLEFDVLVVNDVIR